MPYSIALVEGGIHYRFLKGEIKEVPDSMRGRHTACLREIPRPQQQEEKEAPEQEPTPTSPVVEPVGEPVVQPVIDPIAEEDPLLREALAAIEKTESQRQQEVADVLDKEINEERDKELKKKKTTRKKKVVKKKVKTKKKKPLSGVRIDKKKIKELRRLGKTSL